MGLKTMRPMLGGLPSALSLPKTSAEKDQERIRFHPWRALYKTVEWRKLRWATFVRDNFTCTMCGKIESDTSKLVADHDKPHRGDRALFFDPNNLKTLCASPCHAKHKQKREQEAEFR